MHAHVTHSLLLLDMLACVVVGDVTVVVSEPRLQIAGHYNDMSNTN